ncbi:hypothetical protein CR513_54465, partial [Mucuna pruriens]
MEINISLLDAIKHILKYAKFLKELCSHKRKKLKGDVEIGRNVFALIKSKQVYALIQPTMPKKYGDLGTFANAMFIYRSLKFDDLKPIGVIIQLINRSIVHPLSILEDMLVQVNELIFPANFYVLDMENESSSKESTLILGRPFLMTVRTKIDMHARTLSMEFGDNMVQFNIFEATKHPIENNFSFDLDMIDVLVNDYMQLHFGLSTFSKFSNFAYVADLADFECTCDGCAYLEDDQKLLVIIANNLQIEQEERKIIGWTLANLPRIDPSICMHRILLE